MESIAKIPVKCVECKIWWRGMTHRCDIVPFQPDKPYNPPKERYEEKAEKWDRYKKVYKEEKNLHDQTFTTEFLQGPIV